MPSPLPHNPPSRTSEIQRSQDALRLRDFELAQQIAHKPQRSPDLRAAGHPRVEEGFALALEVFARPRGQVVRDFGWAAGGG